MRTTTSCSGLAAASVIAWLLLIPPFSVTPAGKTFIDTGAPLPRWETLSSHASDTECRNHRDKLREQLESAAATAGPAAPKQSSGKASSRQAEKTKQAFATLRQRIASARCVASNDARLRTPAASPTAR